MKKTLRVLCMGIMAAVSAVSFAQENVTSKLLNADAEKGMLAWDVTFVEGGQIWNKQTKGEEKSPGYYGLTIGHLRTGAIALLRSPTALSSR